VLFRSGEPVAPLTVKRSTSSLALFAANHYRFEVKVDAVNTARALCNSAKNFLAEGADVMTGTEITQVMALSACVSAFISLLVLAAFR
jgi:hypothetical protein